jgi:CheY-like chemotaxis protein
MPDLIISDVMMPNIDGLELCRKLKQNPKTSHIPVVLLTARSAAAHQIEGLENGAMNICQNPFIHNYYRPKYKICYTIAC